MRDHGGNLDWAVQTFGGAPADWIDLSTGINRLPYPVPVLPPEAWTRLPTRAALERLLDAARSNYATTAPIVALAGAQAAIQLIPHLPGKGVARVLGPTYNEHAGALRAAGWDVQEVTVLAELSGADLAVVINPNNPDGHRTRRRDLLNLLTEVGRLVVDESFVDATPISSLAPDADMPGLIVLRSFGKFYGLAGLRLGFALGNAGDIAALTEMAGPWPVSGAAIEIGAQALLDKSWSNSTIERLKEDAQALDYMCEDHGWSAEGGSALFRLLDVTNAAETQAKLARHRIWSRIFPYSKTLIRLGLPGGMAEWDRLESALKRQAPW